MAKKTFEESMAQLEKIVEELEAGNLPLDKALKKFEEGIGLSRACFEKLDETEKKIVQLMEKQDGTAAQVPFAENTAPSEKNAGSNE
jgi:exodeoxyribonuclease VII small subunit